MAQSEGARKHVTTRYQQIDEATLDGLQARFLAGGDVSGAVAWLPADETLALAAETADADRLLGLPAKQVLSGAAEVGPLTDYKRAALAEMLLNAHSSAGAATAESRARALLAEAGRSPTASAALAYEPLYRDLAEAALLESDARLGGTAATGWLLRALAHNLRYYGGDDVFYELVDLASALLQVGELDRGLTMLARLLRHEPRNIGIYHFMATGFGVLGLSRLGQLGARRGLALLDESDDDEALHDELLMAQLELQPAAQAGREAEVSADALAAIEAALRTDFDAGEPASPEALVGELVPELESVPVKAPLRFEDLPEPIRRWAQSLMRRRG